MKKTGIFVLLIICIFAGVFAYSVAVQKNLSDNLLRMHIVANSNSKKDQEIKLSVRNEILKKTGNRAELCEIEATAKQVLCNVGADYGAKADFEKCYVPVKEYKNIRLPEGYYNCIRVVLGEGNGKNWWCVAYPPLCFSEDVFGALSEQGKRELAKRLESESLDVILKDKRVNIKFKAVEEIQKLIRKIG